MVNHEDCSQDNRGVKHYGKKPGLDPSGPPMSISGQQVVRIVENRRYENRRPETQDKVHEEDFPSERMFLLSDVMKQRRLGRGLENLENSVRDGRFFRHAGFPSARFELPKQLAERNEESGRNRVIAAHQDRCRKFRRFSLYFYSEGGGSPNLGLLLQLYP